MRVLVTRPEPDGMKLKGLLEARGHEAEVEPLMRVEFLGVQAGDFESATALIATSRNSLRALQGQPVLREARRLTVYAVGAGTAEEARRLGFATIVKGPGTVAGLLPIITSMLEPSEEMLLHLRGETVSVDVAAELDAFGFRVGEATVYRMAAATALSETVREQIGDGEIEGVMLMSGQTAAIYTRLIQKHRLQLAARQLVHFCLSQGVAARLKPLADVPIELADAPTIEEMLALVDLAAAQSGL